MQGSMAAVQQSHQISLICSFSSARITNLEKITRKVLHQQFFKASKRNNVYNVRRNSCFKASSAVAPVSTADDAATTSHGAGDNRVSPIQRWSSLTDDVSMGPCPRSPGDLEQLISDAKINAFLFLETAEECQRMGLNWERFQAKATELGVISVRIEMKDDDKHHQVASLPEAVRALATLVALGYKVHVSCTSGVYSSPLVALGYLTFVKTLKFEDASRIISSTWPEAEPSMEAWEEVKARMGSGDMRRVAQLAYDVSTREREGREHVENRMVDDWLVGQRLYISESFNKGVDVSATLSEAVVEIETAKATKALEAEVVKTKAVAAELSQRALASREQLDSYAVEIEALKLSESQAKAEVAMALSEQASLKKVAEMLKLSGEQSALNISKANEQVEALTVRLGEAKQREEELNAVVFSANQKLAAVQAQAREAEEREAEVAKDLVLANEKLEVLSARFAEVQDTLQETLLAKENASERVKDIVDQMTVVHSQGLNGEEATAALLQMEKEEAEATAVAEQIQQRLNFLYRQTQSLREKEEVARESLKASNLQAGKLANEVSDLRVRESMALAAASSANREVESLKAQAEAMEVQLMAAKKESEDAKAELVLQQKKISELGAARVNNKVAELQHQLSLSRKKEAEAQGAMAASHERVSFMSRRMQLLKKREEKTRLAHEDRVATFTKQVSELRMKLKAADALAVESHRRIEGLSLQVLELTQREEAARTLAQSAGEKLLVYQSQAEDLQKKEIAAREAAMAATEKAKLLERKVIDLERREAMAMAQSRKFSENVGTLIHINAELGAELEDAKEREGKLLEALDEGMSVLTVAMDADQTIRDLRLSAEKAAEELIEERLRADRLAAELERDLGLRGKSTKEEGLAELKRSLGASSPKPSGSDTRQLQPQLAFTAPPIMASVGGSNSGGGALTAVAHKTEKQLNILRNLALGALAAAAVPLTLSALISGSPNMGASSSSSQSGGFSSFLSKTAVRSASAEGMCAPGSDECNFSRQ